MRRVSSLDPATELAWLKVVVKHEALAVRRGRAGVAGEEIDLDAVPAVAQRSVEERLESAERVERSAEVMRRLKRDEARALMLKAERMLSVARLRATPSFLGLLSQDPAPHCARPATSRKRLKLRISRPRAEFSLRFRPTHRRPGRHARRADSLPDPYGRGMADASTSRSGPVLPR
jgi:hypothetical protein